LSRAVCPDASRPEAGEDLVRAAVRWTGGQPYLTQELCQRLAQERLETPSDVDRFVKRTYPSLESLKSDVHFQTIPCFVQVRVDDRLTALSLYQSIRRGRREPDRTTPAHISLKLSGLVKREKHGTLIVRNPIYRRVFTSRWARAAMPVTDRAARSLRFARR